MHISIRQWIPVVYPPVFLPKNKSWDVKSIRLQYLDLPSYQFNGVALKMCEPKFYKELPRRTYVDKGDGSASEEKHQEHSSDQTKSSSSSSSSSSSDSSSSSSESDTTNT